MMCNENWPFRNYLSYTQMQFLDDIFTFDLSADLLLFYYTVNLSTVSVSVCQLIGCGLFYEAEI